MSKTNIRVSETNVTDTPWSQNGENQKHSLVENSVFSNTLPSPRVHTKIKSLNADKLDVDNTRRPSIQQNPLYVDQIMNDQAFNQRRKRFQKYGIICLILLLLLGLLIAVPVAVSRRRSVAQSGIDCNFDECEQCDKLGDKVDGCKQCMAFSQQQMRCPIICTDDDGSLTMHGTRLCTTNERFPQVPLDDCLGVPKECENFLPVNALNYTACLWCLQNGQKPDCERPYDVHLPVPASCLSDKQKQKLTDDKVDYQNWDKDYDFVNNQSASDIIPADVQGGNSGQTAQPACSINWAWGLCVQPTTPTSDIEGSIQSRLNYLLGDIVDNPNQYSYLPESYEEWQEPNCDCTGPTHKSILAVFKPMPISANDIEEATSKLQELFQSVVGAYQSTLKCEATFPATPAIVCRAPEAVPVEQQTQNGK